jgi:hypothetical protein
MYISSPKHLSSVICVVTSTALVLIICVWYCVLYSSSQHHLFVSSTAKVLIICVLVQCSAQF